MKKHNQSAKAAKQPKLKNRLVLKHGSYSVLLIAVVLAVIVAVNILATVLCRRFPLQLDITSSGENTLSAENADYLRDNIDRNVNIILCATEDGYVNGYMRLYAANEYNAQDSTGKYYAQTLNLLESYEKYNTHINFSYADPDAVSFSAVQSIVPDSTLSYGDILVYSTYNKDGKDITNTKILHFDDLYELTEDSSYYYGSSYTVSGSNVESAVTGAIASVMIDDIKNVALITGHGTEGAFDDFSSVLSNNGFKISTVSDKVLTAIPEETDVAVIAAPTSDFTADELKLLENFLENGGKKGKNLVVFCNYEADTPLLNEFLAEWGISCESKSVVYETDADNIYYDNTLFYSTNAGTDYTESVNTSDAYYLSVSAVPMTTAYTTYNNRVTNVLMTTSDTCISVPVSELLAANEASGSWKPSAEYKQQSFATAILTADTTYSDGAAYVSNVVAFSDYTFISDVLASDPFGNSAFAAAVFKSIAGSTDSGVYFMPKAVSTFQFTTSPTATSIAFMQALFIVIVPLAIIGVGCTVWIRRKRR